MTACSFAVENKTNNEENNQETINDVCRPHLVLCGSQTNKKMGRSEKHWA